MDWGFSGHCKLHSFITFFLHWIWLSFPSLILKCGKISFSFHFRIKIHCETSKFLVTGTIVSGYSWEFRCLEYPSQLLQMAWLGARNQEHIIPRSFFQFLWLSSCSSVCIQIGKSRTGSERVPKSSVKITAWYTLIATPKYHNATISHRTRLIIQIWGYRGSNSVFSKIHLDIFKYKMQRVFMFHFYPYLNIIIFSTPLVAINSKSRQKAWHMISAEEQKRFKELPTAWWQYSWINSSGSGNLSEYVAYYFQGWSERTLKY